MKRSFFDRYFGLSGSIRRHQILFILCVVLPLLSLFMIIRIMPLAATFGLSMTNHSVLRPTTEFMGLKNFILLLEDEQFMSALLNSVEYVLVAVPVEILLGLLIAILLTRKVKFESLYDTLYFIPYILPMVPAAIIWKWFYAPGSFGLANYLLESLGLPQVLWMSDPKITLLITIGIHIWKNLGYFVIIFTVGLKQIPKDLKEACRVDGATVWQSIKYIELPLLKPIMLFCLVMATLWAWSAFTEIYIMTEGTDISTGAEIQVLIYRVYTESFIYQKMGYASAISFVTFMVSGFLVFVQFLLFKSRGRGR